MPWFTPIARQPPSASLSQSQPYRHDSHPINPPPPSAVVRKIKEQTWYNSIKAKAAPTLPPTPSPPIAFTSTPLGIADTPLRAPRASPTSGLPFLRSQKAHHAPYGGPSPRRPKTASHADDIRSSSNFKVATLNKKNLQHHNDTITTTSTPQTSPALIHPAVATQRKPNDDFDQLPNSARSISASAVRHPKRTKPSPAFSQHTQASQLFQQTHTPSSAAHDFEAVTQSLAIRLQELATANQDGLLDDGEYRTLRQGLFDQMTANNNEPSVIDTGPDDYESFPNTASPLQSTFNEQQCPSPHLLQPSTCTTNTSPSAPAPSLRRSLRSTASTASFIQSLFKRQARWLRTKTVTSDSEEGYFFEEPEPSSTFPQIYSPDPPPLLTRPLHHRPEIHGQSPASNPVSRGDYSQSMAYSLSAPSKTSYSPIHPKNDHSTRSLSTHSKTSRMVNTTTTTVVATADQAHTTAAAMRREISDLEYERGRVLETFVEMERAAITRQRGGRDGLTVNEEVMMDSPRCRPQSFLAPLPGAATLGTNTYHRRQRGTHASPPPMPKIEPRSVVEQSSESSELEKQLEEIRVKKKAVEDRYAGRLEYLNAKLKGAMIRERT